jgi:hypothetical protein
MLTSVFHADGLFYRILSFYSSLVALNLMWAVSLLGIVTAPAGTFALFAATRRLLVEGNGTSVGRFVADLRSATRASHAVLVPSSLLLAGLVLALVWSIDHGLRLLTGISIVGCAFAGSFLVHAGPALVARTATRDVLRSMAYRWLRAPGLSFAGAIAIALWLLIVTSVPLSLVFIVASVLGSLPAAVTWTISARAARPRG